MDETIVSRFGLLPAGHPDLGADNTPESGDLFDPSGHNVDDVNSYLASLDVEDDYDERERVLGLERSGKARTGILGAS